LLESITRELFFCGSEGTETAHPKSSPAAGWLARNRIEVDT